MSYDDIDGKLDVQLRRDALLEVLTFTQARGTGAVALMELVDELGLEVELAELAGLPVEEPERHRRIAAARAEAELEDLVLVVLERTVEGDATV